MGKKIVPIVAVIAIVLVMVVGLFTPLGTYIPYANQIKGNIADEATLTPFTTIIKTLTSTDTTTQTLYLRSTDTDTQTAQIQIITQTQDCSIDVFGSYPFALLKAKDLGYGDYAIMNPITTQILPPGTNMTNLGLVTKIKTYGVVLANPEDTSLGLMVFVDECGEIFHHMVLPPEVMKTITESLQPLPPPKLTE